MMRGAGAYKAVSGCDNKEAKENKNARRGRGGAASPGDDVVVSLRESLV